MDWLEVSHLLCVYLAVKENIWNWPIGVANILVGVFLALSFEVKPYGGFFLDMVYLVLQIYGWWYWLQNRGRRKVRPTTRVSRRELAVLVLIGTGVGLGLGHFLPLYTDAPVRYLDAMTMAFGLVAQWLLSRKVLENWCFWMACYVVDMGIYSYQGLYPTAGSYAVFLLLAVQGFREWRKEMCAPAVEAKGDGASASPLGDSCRRTADTNT